MLSQILMSRPRKCFLNYSMFSHTRAKAFKFNVHTPEKNLETFNVHNGKYFLQIFNVSTHTGTMVPEIFNVHIPGNYLRKYIQCSHQKIHSWNSLCLYTQENVFWDLQCSHTPEPKLSNSMSTHTHQENSFRNIQCPHQKILSWLVSCLHTHGKCFLKYSMFPHTRELKP